MRGGATTLVNDGVEGFIVPGSDPEHIAEAMIKIAADRNSTKRWETPLIEREPKKIRGRITATALSPEYGRRRFGRHTVLESPNSLVTLIACPLSETGSRLRCGGTGSTHSPGSRR